MIPVISELLDDKAEGVRAWAAIALFRLAESDVDLQKKIEEITFPKTALQSAKGRSVEAPVWTKVKEI